MRKTNGKQSKLSPIFIVFLVVALVFLAVGLGTLGTTRTTGGDFELRTEREGDAQTPTVIFQLNNSLKEVYVNDSGVQTERTVSLKVVDIYLNVTSIYSEAGTPAGVAVRRSTSATQYFSGKLEGTLENIYTAPTTNEDGEEEIVTPSATDALYNWVKPFTLPAAGWGTSYKYVELTATTHDIRIGEVVFIGMDANNTANETRYVIPATIQSATPTIDQSAEQAVEQAKAMLDAQVNVQASDYAAAKTMEERLEIGLPVEPIYSQSSYDHLSGEELYSMLTITEMRTGRTFSNVTGVYYNGDKVYNVLGIDMLALGTLIFGNSPFGLRFFPMLASFGVLVLGYFFVKRLTNSEKAGLVFAVLYALCNLSFSLGHLGTPLMIGVFFLTLSLYLCHSFYVRGMKKESVVSALPLFGAGIFGAAAICVSGAFVVPVLGVVALFVAGLVRQLKARRYYLDAAIAEAEAEGSVVSETEGSVNTEEEVAPPSEGKKKVARVLSEYRYKNLMACFGFAASLILGALIISLLAVIPVYSTLIKLYDTPVAPTLNFFTAGWKAFTGGFIGVNQLGTTQSVWSLFYVLFEGTGSMYAVTAVVVNAVAAVLGILGLVYAICRIVAVLKVTERGKEERSELRRILVPLCGLVLSLITAIFAKGALAFILLAYVFSFVLAALAADHFLKGEKHSKGVKAGIILAIILLVACFAAFAVFTFSVPLPAEFLSSILG